MRPSEGQTFINGQVFGEHQPIDAENAGQVRYWADRLKAPSMLSADECLAKADEMEQLARSGPPEIRESYAQMVAGWRTLATQAAWQDGHEVSEPPDVT